MLNNHLEESIMKKLFILSVCLLLGNILSAQDIITKNDGTDIKAKVTEVEQSQVKYKKYSNLEGPTYTISLSDVLMITYENGEREMYNTKKNTEFHSVYPQGVMTYNSWSGKISIGGETIPSEMEEMYFYPEDYELYKSGKSQKTLGTVIACIGALPFGYSIGYMGAAGETDETNLGLLVGGGAALAVGIVINALGGNKMKKAISSYNSNLAFQPEFRFGATPNGVGIACVF